MTYTPVEARFYRRGAIDTVRVLPPPGVLYETLRFSHRAIGGPYRANVRAIGALDSLISLMDYLRYGVELYDQQGVLCWWGYVHEVRIRLGVTEFGVSMERVANRIKVQYKSLAAGEDATEDSETDWGAESVSVNEYGTREAILDAGQLVLTEEAAEALRDTRLAQLAHPLPIADFEDRTTEPFAELICRGWWDTLSWQHYSQSAGRIRYEEGDGGIQAIGQASYTTGTTITWEENGSEHYLYDTDSAMLRYSVGQVVIITSSNNNNGTYDILDVYPTGQRLTFEQDVDDDFTTESVIINPDGDKAAQSFTTGASDDWTVATVAVRAMTKGAPTDALRVSIHADNPGEPAAQLGSGTLDSAEMDGVMRWRTITLNTPVALSPSTTYWIVVDRNGASNAANCYHVELDNEAGHSGAYMTWNGSAWSTRAGFDMLFDIIGGRDTSDLISGALDDGQFFTSATVEDASGVLSALVQIDDQTLKRVIEGWMETGTTAGRRYLSHVNNRRAARVFVEPYVSDGFYYRDRDGTLYTEKGVRIEPQRFAAGVWLRSRDIDAVTTSGTALRAAGVAFIEESEWTNDDKVRLLARGAVNIWEL